MLLKGRDIQMTIPPQLDLRLTRRKGKCLIRFFKKPFDLYRVAATLNAEGRMSFVLKILIHTSLARGTAPKRICLGEPTAKVRWNRAQPKPSNFGC
jgi:hypothetical protein